MGMGKSGSDLNSESIREQSWLQRSVDDRRSPLPAFVRLFPRLPPTFDFGVTRRRGKQQPLMHHSLLRPALRRAQRGFWYGGKIEGRRKRICAGSCRRTEDKL